MKNKLIFKPSAPQLRDISLEKGNFKNGFTLIELIVTITIIAIISVIAVVNFSEANRKARDTKRMSDVEKIRIALELARQVGTTYPPSLGDLTPNFLQSLPNGPKGDIYVYTPSDLGGGFTFTLDAYLEGVGSTTATNYTTDCGLGTCNYRVTNP